MLFTAFFLALFMVMLALPQSAIAADAEGYDLPFDTEALEDSPFKREKLSIDGMKTFEIRQNRVQGDLNHFSMENFDTIPGFHFDQSLQLKIEGEIIDNVFIKANLDDSPSMFPGEQQKEMMLFIDGKIWDITLGDFWATLPETEFTLYNKKLKGFKVEADFMNHLHLNALISRSEGVAGFYVSQGLGHQQEYQLPRNTLPIIEKSETVYLDSRKMNRGQDYSIDYEDGTLRFKSHILPIESNQRINVEYQYDESQAAYKKNLMALQLAGRIDQDNAIGLTFVQDAHDKSSPLIDIDENTSKPMSHRIYDLYIKSKFRDNFRLKGEYSKSVRDFNALSDLDELVEGTATRLEFNIGMGQGAMDVAYRRIEPLFVSVGKRGFATLGQEGLVGDISQISVRSRYDGFRGVKLSDLWEKSYTNVMDIPDRIRKDYLMNDLMASYDHSENLGIRIRSMNENKRTPEMGLDTQRNIRSVQGVLGYGFLQIDGKGELEETFNKATEVLDNRITKSSFVLATRKVRRVDASMGVESLVTEKGPDENPVMDVQNLTVNLNVNPSRMLSAVGVFLNRKERDLVQGYLNTTTTADMRLKLTPLKSLTSTLKYKETHTRRSLKEKDGEALVETPINTVTATALVEYTPIKSIRTSIDLRTKDIIDETTNEKYSRSNSLRSKMRYSPSQKLSTTLEFNVNQSNNDRATEPVSRDSRSEETAVSMKKSFQKGLSFETKYSYQDRRHRYDPLDTAQEQGLTFRVQKQVNSRILSNLDYQISRVDGLEDYLKTNVDSAVTYSDWSREIRLSLRYHFGKEFREVEKVRHEGTVQMDYKLSRDTKFVGEVKMISQSPDATLGDGYSATLGSGKVEIRF